jgi:SAM-dependent methyltransferase
MNTSRHPARDRAPDSASHALPADSLYRLRAARYDLELAPFEPLRTRALAALALQPGQTVLDMGCGTGLSLAGLRQAVGPQGRVIGVEPCPDMLAMARARVLAQAWANVPLQARSAADSRLPRQADAALFHFTHDVLQQPKTVAHVLSHLRPGATVVACGLCWAGVFNWPGNLFVLGAALYSVTTLQGMDQPWRVLARQLPTMQVERLWSGAIYLARGTVG